MGTEIKTWQILDGRLEPIDVSLRDGGRTEPEDLEQWLVSDPTVISADITIIGRQVATKSGPIDLLAIDQMGNLVVIELKRDRLPREALAQAVDYASDVADWTVDKISEVCTGYRHKSLDEAITESFPDTELENLNINSAAHHPRWVLRGRLA